MHSTRTKIYEKKHGSCKNSIKNERVLGRKHTKANSSWKQNVEMTDSTNVSKLKHISELDFYQPNMVMFTRWYKLAFQSTISE